MTIANEKFHLGGKKITAITDKYGAHVPNITFICKKSLPKTQRESILAYNKAKE